MSNEVIMTIAGNVVENPTMRRIPGGAVVTNFRVASTSRRYDREQQGFVDNTTLFVTVSAWRALGENVHASIKKGQPVVVTGRYSQRNYTVNEQPRTSYELEATSVGHDLARGVTTFTKVFRSATPTVALDGAGQPSDDSGGHRYSGPAANGEVREADPAATGTELQEPAAEYGGYEPDPAARGLAIAS